MLFLLAFGVLLVSGSCVEVEYVEAPLGEQATMTTSEGGSSFLSLRDAKGEALCTYDAGNGEVWEIKYPDKHDASVIGSVFYFSIKEVKIEDTMTYYWDEFGSINAQSILYVYFLDNSDLHNKVFGYGNYSRFAYQTEMEGNTRIQWSFQQQQNSNQTSETIDIYYANKDTGGVLPNAVGSFKESQGGFGVSVNSMTFEEAGRYQCIVTRLPNAEQIVFDIAVTRNFGCQPAEYLINGKEQSQSCSAEVSNGDIAPEFTWFRNGQIVDGTLSSELVGSNTVVYTYTHTFEAGWDDLGANYTCLQTFKYVGPESDLRDTSDPAYRDTCSLSYTDLEYAPYNAMISPSSDNGDLILRIGQEFACSANGTGSLNYEWNCHNDDYLGQILKITDIFFTKGYTLCICIAWSRLSDQFSYSTIKRVYFSVVHQSNILAPPPPVIFSYIGEKVQLNCSLAPYVNSSLTIDDFDYQWTANFLDDDDSIKNLIYSASDEEYGVFDQWSDEFEAGDFKHDLVMKSAQFQLEGLYRCEAINYPDVYAFGVNIIVTDRVNCTSSFKKAKRGETVEISCQVEHTGSIEPEMIWYADNAAVSLQGSASTIRNDFTTVTELAVDIEAKPGVSYKCGVTFRSGLSSFTDECEAFIEFDDEAEHKQEVKKVVDDIRENFVSKQHRKTL